MERAFLYLVNVLTLQFDPFSFSAKRRTDSGSMLLNRKSACACALMKTAWNTIESISFSSWANMLQISADSSVFNCLFRSDNILNSSNVFVTLSSNKLGACATYTDPDTDTFLLEFIMKFSNLDADGTWYDVLWSLQKATKKNNSKNELFTQRMFVLAAKKKLFPFRNFYDKKLH